MHVRLGNVSMYVCSWRASIHCKYGCAHVPRYACIYVLICLYLHKCVDVFAHVFEHLFLDMPVCVCLCRHVFRCVFVWMSVCLYACMYVRMYICTYVRTCECMDADEYCMCVCVCLCVSLMSTVECKWSVFVRMHMGSLQINAMHMYTYQNKCICLRYVAY